MSTDTTSLLRITQVAELLDCSEKTIRRRVDDGQIPAVRLGDAPTSPIRIEIADIAAFLERSSEGRRP